MCYYKVTIFHTEEIEGDRDTENFIYFICVKI